MTGRCTIKIPYGRVSNSVICFVPCGSLEISLPGRSDYFGRDFGSDRDLRPLDSVT